MKARMGHSGRHLSRRGFLVTASRAAAAASLGATRGWAQEEGSVKQRPNVVFVFADQMRAQACGFMGNAQVRTPHLDHMAEQGVVFTRAVSCCPVCTPYRASLMTGRYPLTNGMVLNDVRLPITERSIGKVFREAGYQTGYVGKWHLDGPFRGGYTPPGPRRQGFDYWSVANCTHDYMHSYYFHNDPEPIWIYSYDADLHTSLAIDFIRKRYEAGPFCLFLSWGPPHDPCLLMPEEYKVYDGAQLELRPNCTDPVREELAGYYSHITALDRNFGRLTALLDELGIADHTLLVFTSDHGDMLGSQGQHRKQKPWDESIMVPFALRYPERVPAGRRTDTLLNTPDLMPTLLSLAGIEAPEEVEGQDLSHAALGQAGPEPTSALIANYCPFIEPIPEWRGVRTKRHTYVKTLEGPWLLYDNEADPYQMDNLVDSPEHADLRRSLEGELQEWLDRTNDAFEPRENYWKRFGYEVRENGEYPFHTEVGLSDL
jgi:arylsulfatase A-like enzyme